MKRYNVVQARQHLAEVLDRVEGGEKVVIERRGVRFQLTTLAESPRKRRRAPRIEIIDPAVEDGAWSWQWSPGGVEFRDGRERSRK